jgi:hypothetical protein
MTPLANLAEVTAFAWILSEVTAFDANWLAPTESFANCVEEIEAF